MNPVEISGRPDVLKLLGEAAEWRLIALLFECPRSGWHGQVEALGLEVQDPELREAAKEALSHAEEGLYHTIFGPGGPAPPREMTYRQSLQAGGLLAEILARYDAFAYQPSSGESFDHVCVEADFVGYLRVKEAYARLRDEEEQAVVTSQAARAFIEDHLAELADPLALTLADSGIPYLEKAAKALRLRTETGHPSDRDTEPRRGL
jgi:nitrate reductase assembly molybdenum cofactor insertion protein NarJ